MRKNIPRRSFVIALVVTVLASATPLSWGARKAAVRLVPLSAQEQSDLKMMREEEKLARDVYLALAAKWKLKVFTNIARSEQTHMDVVGNLLKTYNVADPVAGLAPGKFASPEFQQMYKDLVAAGSQSIVDALIVGATIEEIDIVDLLECLDRTTHADIRRVYSNIEGGSENHLRAFVGNLDALDVEYEPQYLDPELYWDIIAP